MTSLSSLCKLVEILRATNPKVLVHLFILGLVFLGHLHLAWFILYSLSLFSLFLSVRLAFSLGHLLLLSKRIPFLVSTASCTSRFQNHESFPDVSRQTSLRFHLSLTPLPLHASSSISILFAPYPWMNFAIWSIYSLLSAFGSLGSFPPPFLLSFHSKVSNMKSILECNGFSWHNLTALYYT